MKLIYAPWLFATFAFVASLNNVVIRKAREASEHNPDTEFDVPSVTVQYAMPTKVVNLEAYATRNRDTEHMHWLSIGYPIIAKVNGQLFQYTSSEIILNVQLLEQSQKKALIKQAQLLFKNSTVNKKDISLIPLERFACGSSFIVNSQQHKMQGVSVGLLSNQVPIRFPLDQAHPIRKALKLYLQHNPMESLVFECHLSAGGKKVRQNSLVIKGMKDQAEDLIGKLVGPAKEGYVTRDQMTSFAQAISTRYNVEQDYEIDKEQFTDAFINQILESAKESFKEVSFDIAAERLSTYGVSDGAEGLKPDEIKRQLSDVFTVRNDSGHQTLVVKDTKSDSGGTDTKVSGHHEATVGIPKLVSATTSVDWAVNHKQDWEKNKTSIDDQLRDMNKNSQDNVKFDFDGLKVIPKSLNVARVSETQLTQSFTFQRIKRRVAEARYFKTYELSLVDNKDLPSDWEEFRTGTTSTQEKLASKSATIRMESLTVGLKAKPYREKYTEDLNDLKAALGQSTATKSQTQVAAAGAAVGIQGILSAKKWTRIPGYAKHISCKQSNLWAMNENYQAMYFNGSAWASIPHVAHYPAATSKRDAWYLRKLNQDVDVYNFNMDTGDSKRVSFNCMQINALTPDKAMCTTQNGRVFTYVENRTPQPWVQLNEDFRAYEAAIGEGMEIWAIDFKNDLHRYHEGKWIPMGHKAKHVDVQSRDRVVITGFDNVAYIRTEEDQWKPLTGKECQQATINFDNVFCLTPGGEIFSTVA